MSNQLTYQEQQYQKLAASKEGFEAFTKLFEIAGHSPEQSRNLAEKEAYHLSQLMCDSEDLRTSNPVALLMELRKVPLLGVSLDPSLKLAYLIVQDKAAGKVQLEVTGRGKVVQAIAQGIVRNVDVTIVYEGDKVESHNGILHIVPDFNNEGKKVIGGFLTIVWPDGRVTQEVYKQSHIENWKARSAKRFKGKANANYESFNGGIEPGFMASKMLKHKLDRIGINPFPIPRPKLEELARLAPITNEEVKVYSEEQPFAAKEGELDLEITTKF